MTLPGKLRRRRHLSRREAARREEQRAVALDEKVKVSEPPVVTPKYDTSTHYTNSRLWTTWNTNYYTTASTTTTSNYITNDTIWRYWQNTSTTTGSIYLANNQIAWEGWNSNYLKVYRPYGTPRVVETDEERTARLAAEETRRQERLAAQALRIEEEKAAKERANALLVQNLTEEQRKEWEATGQFHVRSQSGRRYCIKRGRQHNIFEVDAQGRRLKELCGHVREAVPNEDNVLAQKLALELMEADFLKTCNIWDLTRPGRPCISHSGRELALV